MNVFIYIVNPQKLQRKLKVLIIENDFVSRHYLRDLLTYSGHTCQSAMNASEGLDIYANDRPDIIICNVLLPGISGFEFLRDIRKSDSKTPVIMMATESSERLAIHAFRAGADDFLKKPIQDKDIIPLVQEFENRLPKPEETPSTYGQIEAGRLKFTFPTEIDGAHSIRSRIMDSLDETFFDTSDRMGIEFGLSELITNAIEHGNLGITYDEKTAVSDDPAAMSELCHKRLLDNRIASRRVTIYYEFDAQECKWTIIDEGDGFDVSKVPDPSKNPNPSELLHGRGIWFTRAVFDSVEYHGRGNEVVVTKKRNFLL